MATRPPLSHPPGALPAAQPLGGWPSRPRPPARPQARPSRLRGVARVGELATLRSAPPTRSTRAAAQRRRAPRPAPRRPTPIRRSVRRPPPALGPACTSTAPPPDPAPRRAVDQRQRHGRGRSGGGGGRRLATARWLKGRSGDSAPATGRRRPQLREVPDAPMRRQGVAATRVARPRQRAGFGSFASSSVSTSFGSASGCA